MTAYPHKVFEKDRILRDENLRPVGRVVLAKPYVAGENLAVTLLKAPKSLYATVLGQVFYVDGVAYRVPLTVDPVRVSATKLDHLINNFYLEVVR